MGSIREITDAAGTAQNSYTYGTWGELRAQNVTVPNSYGYTGREFAEEGLYFYRTRFLSPSLGRFISEDLVGELVDMNLYRYIQNNPINSIDPFGLTKMPIEMPNPNCCSLKSIEAEIESVKHQMDRMNKGQQPSGSIGGMTLVIEVKMPTGGGVVQKQDPKDFKSWVQGCDSPDPCVNYCCYVHEWFHYTDYRTKDPKLTWQQNNIRAERPAYMRELQCLAGFKNAK